MWTRRDISRTQQDQNSTGDGHSSLSDFEPQRNPRFLPQTVKSVSYRSVSEAVLFVDRLFFSFRFDVKAETAAEAAGEATEQRGCLQVIKTLPSTSRVTAPKGELLNGE